MCFFVWPDVRIKAVQLQSYNTGKTKSSQVLTFKNLEKSQMCIYLKDLQGLLSIIGNRLIISVLLLCFKAKKPVENLTGLVLVAWYPVPFWHSRNNRILNIKCGQVFWVVAFSVMVCSLTGWFAWRNEAVMYNLVMRFASQGCCISAPSIITLGFD